MRFEKLYLKAFGPFTEFTMDFSEKTKGFQLIYGLNEAGKSSLLRGIFAILFGIPERTTDNFLHENSKLRVGAIFSRNDGKTFPFLRRKGRKNFLFDLDESPIDDLALRSFCSFPEENLFQSIFGLDHRLLEEGGHNILSGEGNLGETLFEAGAGTLGLRKKLSSLENELGDLFKPLGSNPVINQAVKKYKDAKSQQKFLSLKGDEWLRMTREYEDLQKKISNIGITLKDCNKEKEKLTRIQNSLPLLAQRTNFLNELAQLSEVPDLPTSAEKERITTLRDLQEAQTDITHAQEKKKKLEDEISTIHLPPKIIDHSENIGELYQRLGSYRDAAEDLPERQAEFDFDYSKAKTKLTEINPELTLEQAETLRLQPSEIVRIRDLVKRYDVLSNNLKLSQQSIATIMENLQQTNRKLATCPKEIDLSRLQASIDTVKTLGNLEERYQEGLQDVDTLKDQVLADISALGLGTTSIENFQALQVPLQETVTRFDQERTDLENEKNSLSAQITSAKVKTDQLVKERNNIEASGDITTQTQLKETRDWRDKGWHIVRQAYIEKEIEPESPMAQFDENHPLPEAYELAVANSDHIADLLRADSERVAQFQSLTIQLSQLHHEKEILEEKKMALEKGYQKHVTAWNSVWEPLEVQTLSPKEMMVWLQNHRRVLDHIDNLRISDDKVKLLSRNIDGAWKTLNAALISTELPQAVPGEGLAVLLSRSENLLDSISETNDKTKSLKEKVIDQQGDLEKAQEKLESAKTDLDGWRKDWEPAIKPIGLTSEASTSVVEALLENLEYLFKALDNATTLETRITGMKARVTSYGSAINFLASEIAADLVNGNPENVIEKIYQRYLEANKDSQKKENLEQQISDCQKQENESQRQEVKYQNRLQDLCKQAKCENVEALPEIEENSSRKKSLLAEIRKIEEQLVEQNCDSIENILKETEAADLDGIPHQIQDLESKNSLLDNERSEFLSKSGEMKAALQNMDGRQKAADALQEAEERKAEIQEAVNNYIRIQLSIEVLRHGIEEYRKKHQGPLLKKAAEIFPIITQNSFSFLKTGFDDNDRPILLGVRENGAELKVNAMSDGTADQLFLALRLSAIERYMELSEPTPLILDDILIQFDDPRAESTLRILERLSKKTQILFLTHHSHIVSLAKKSVSPDSLQIHTISGYCQLNDRWAN